MPPDPSPTLAPTPAPPPAGASGPLWPLWLLAAGLVLPELILLGADAGLWGSRIWRPLAWQYGGFWAGLWRGWVPNYAAQPWTMMLTYSALHAGPGHLLGNLAGLWSAGAVLRAQGGTARVLAVWVAGTVGGALAFGWLAASPAPMIGASGAVFGLVGAWWWADTARPLPAADPAGHPAARRIARRIARAAGLLVLLVAANAAMYLTSTAGIAWETHLGGFLAGAALAAALPRPGAGRGSAGSGPAAAPREEEPAEGQRQQR